jgi:uncharacterized protein YjbI with pentapeptide repeats
MRSVSLREADLSQTSLREANLGRADLSEANLCGADLTGVALRGAGLLQAAYNRQTKWPVGLIPTITGAILTDSLDQNLP